MILILLLALANHPQSDSQPIVVEQVSVTVRDGALEVHVIPAPTWISLRVNGSIIQPTTFSQEEGPDEAQRGAASFPVPSGEFEVMIKTTGCERAVLVSGLRPQGNRP
jgi:hypothetical protein